jgi:Leucine-rich repeat (LRR) protein
MKSKNSQSIKSNKTKKLKSIRSNKTEKLKIMLSKDLATSVSKDIATSISKDLATSISKDLATSISKDLATSISKDLATSISKDLATSISKDLATSISKDLATSISDEKTTMFSNENLEIISKELAMVPNKELILVPPNIKLAINNIKKLTKNQNINTPPNIIKQFSKSPTPDSIPSPNITSKIISIEELKKIPMDKLLNVPIKNLEKISKKIKDIKNVNLAISNIKESVKSPIKELVKSPIKELVKSPIKELVKSPIKELVKSSIKESVKSLSKNIFNQIFKFTYNTLLHNENYNFNNSNLETLDLSKFPNIEKLYCSNNKITHLDLSGCTNLTVLYCNHNEITHLDLSGCPNLTVLYCNNNNISNLVLLKNKNLKNLYCNNNKIKSLILPNRSKLEILDCRNNQITYFDLSNCYNLNKLNCENNNINEKSKLHMAYVLKIYFSPELKAMTSNIPIFTLTNIFNTTINNNLIPFENLRMGTIHSFDDITKNNNLKFLSGNLDIEIRNNLYRYFYLEVIYEYIIDDDVLVYNIGENIQLIQSLNKNNIMNFIRIFTLALNMKFNPIFNTIEGMTLPPNSINLFIEPNVNFTYIDLRFNCLTEMNFNSISNIKLIAIHSYKVSKK